MRINATCWTLAVSALVALSGCSNGGGSSWAFWRTSPFQSAQGATPSGVGCRKSPPASPPTTIRPRRRACIRQPIPALRHRRGDNLTAVGTTPRQTPATTCRAATRTHNTRQPPAPLAATTELPIPQARPACRVLTPTGLRRQARPVDEATITRARPRAATRRRAPRALAAIRPAAAAIRRAVIHRATTRRAAHRRTICARIRSAAIHRIRTPIRTDTTTGRPVPARAQRATAAAADTTQPRAGRTTRLPPAATVAPALRRQAAARATETLRQALPICRGPVRRRPAVTRRPAAVTRRHREVAMRRQAPHFPRPAAATTRHRVRATRRQTRARPGRAIRRRAPARPANCRLIVPAARASTSRQTARQGQFRPRRQPVPPPLRPAIRRRWPVLLHQPAAAIRHRRATATRQRRAAVTHRPLTITHRRLTVPRHRPAAASHLRAVAILRQRVLECRKRLPPHAERALFHSS